jgi:hypothetical protein
MAGIIIEPDCVVIVPTGEPIPPGDGVRTSFSDFKKTVKVAPSNSVEEVKAQTPFVAGSFRRSFWVTHGNPLKP